MSDDLISRQVVLDAIRRISLGQTDVVKVSMMTEEYVKALPPVKQEPKTGHWIFKNFDRETGLSNCDWCSECGKPSAQVYKTYCGNCGAKME